MSHPPQDTPGSGEDRAGRARRLLQIADDTPAESVPGLMLDRLQEADFVPPAGWRQAVRTLAAPDRFRPPADDDVLLAAEHSGVLEEVEALASAWFDLPPDARRSRWTDLAARCAPFPPLAARLRGLEPSLSVEFPAGGQGDPRIGALIGHVRKSLTLRPPARDALDWEFLAAVRKETAEESEVARPSATLPWPEAFRRFQEGFPQIARLVPDFLRAAAAIPWELYRGQEAGSQNRQTKTEGPSAADSPAQSDRKAPARADLPQQSSAPPAPAAGESAQRAPSGSESGSWGVGQWLLVLLAIFLARAACTGISHRPPSRIELPPVPAPWTGPSRDDGKWLQETTRRLLEEHRKKMEKARPFVPEGPPPGPAAVPEVKTPGAAPGPAPSAPRR